MQHQPDEVQLIAQAQQGDEQAVTLLYEYHVDAVFQYIRYRVDSKSTAEDLTSEVFLRMVRGLKTYHAEGIPLKAWLLRIAANLVIDHYRQQNKYTATPINDDFRSNEPDPFDLLAQSEDQSRLYLALRALPENYRQLLHLRFVENLSHIEIATMLDKSVDSLRSLQYRALKALADQFSQFDTSSGSYKGEEQ